MADLVSQYGAGDRAGDNGAMVAVADLFSDHSAENTARDDRQCPRQAAARTAVRRVAVVIDHLRFVVMVSVAMYHARPLVVMDRRSVMVNHSGTVMMSVVMMSVVVMTMVMFVMMAVAPMVAPGVYARCESEQGNCGYRNDFG